MKKMKEFRKKMIRYQDSRCQQASNFKFFRPKTKNPNVASEISVLNSTETPSRSAIGPSAI
jgi:hypothetical protein